MRFVHVCAITLPKHVILVLTLVLCIVEQTHALVFDSTHAEVEKQRDKAIQEAETAQKRNDELQKEMIRRADNANPELKAAAQRAQTEAVEAQRSTNQLQLKLEEMTSSHSNSLNTFKAVGGVILASCVIIALVVGIALGTRTRRDAKRVQSSTDSDSIPTSNGM